MLFMPLLYCSDERMSLYLASAAVLNQSVLSNPSFDPNNANAAGPVAELRYDTLEEERRLAYVALSRARDALYLSFILRDQSSNPMVETPDFCVDAVVVLYALV